VTITFTTTPTAPAALTADPVYGTASLRFDVHGDGATDEMVRVSWFPTGFGAVQVASLRWTAGSVHDYGRSYTVAADGVLLVESAPSTLAGATAVWTEVGRAAFTLDHGAQGQPPVLPPLPSVPVPPEAGCEVAGVRLFVEVNLLPLAAANYERPPDPFGRPSDEYRSWLDITPFVRQVDIVRGRQDPFVPMPAGSCTVTVDNLWRYLDTLLPTNAAGVGLAPMTPLRVFYERNGVRHALFHGFTQGAEYAYQPPGPADATQTIVALDALSEFAGWSLEDDDPVLAGGLLTPTEMAGARIARFLGLYGWAADKMRLDAGQVPLLPQSLAGQKVLEQLQKVEASEFGVLFVTGDDTVVFHDRRRSWIDLKPIVAIATSCLNDLPALPHANLVPGAPVVEYQNVTWGVGVEGLANHVGLTRVQTAQQFVIESEDTGAGVTKRDAESVWRYGLREFSGVGNELIVESNAHLDLIADIVLEMRAWPRPQFRTITLDADVCRGFFDVIDTLELRDTLMAHLHLNAVHHVDEVTVEGITHSIVAGGSWTTVVSTAKAVAMDWLPVTPPPGGGPALPPAFRPPNVEAPDLFFQPWDGAQWQPVLKWTEANLPSRVDHVEVRWTVGGATSAMQVPLGNAWAVYPLPVAPGTSVTADVSYIGAGGERGTATRVTEIASALPPTPSVVPQWNGRVDDHAWFDGSFGVPDVAVLPQPEHSLVGAFVVLTMDGTDQRIMDVWPTRPASNDVRLGPHPFGTGTYTARYRYSYSNGVTFDGPAATVQVQHTIPPVTGATLNDGGWGNTWLTWQVPNYPFPLWVVIDKSGTDSHRLGERPAATDGYLGLSWANIGGQTHTAGYELRFVDAYGNEGGSDRTATLTWTRPLEVTINYVGGYWIGRSWYAGQVQVTPLNDWTVGNYVTVTWTVMDSGRSRTRQVYLSFRGPHSVDFNDIAGVGDMFHGAFPGHRWTMQVSCDHAGPYTFMTTPEP
jgi:hypothetical protein